MRYVIIGSGIAGLSAAEAIRSVDREGSVTILTGEKGLPYSRPMLTKTPFASFDPKAWTVFPEAWFQENAIALCEKDVRAIDRDAKTVATCDGETIPYDKLILATGADNFIPPFGNKDFEGRLKDGIFTIRTADDIYAIKARCLPGARAVVIGGGVIGIEAALELLRYGVEVTILEAMPYLMMRQIDPEISARIVDILADAAAVQVITGANITRIEGERAATGVTLADGQTFPCDFVIVSCGVRARTALAAEAGLKVGRAIQIDDHARTEDPDVYAAGDCAEFRGVNYALWAQGILEGKAAGLNAAGKEAYFDRFDSSLVINSPFLSLLAVGDLGKQEGADYQIRYLTPQDAEHRYYVNPQHGAFIEKQYWLNGELVGTGIIGNLAGMQDRKVQILGETGIHYVE
ncbi:MAG: NAD(P)/FAD-dependent oxidoreductase [Firmicutes bacterium]|nr:NAD(P)/FAD-dependent oxidoreductase [Bacillota bacterium]